MLPDIGNLCLYIALSICLFVSIAPILEKLGFSLQYKYYTVAWLAVFIVILISFFILIYSYIISDFSILNVVNNSHTSKPLIYKISGAWGNHEGSMLLWITAINVFTIIFCIMNRDESLGKLTLSVQAICNTFFIAFTLFISSPFTRIFPAPKNGFGLNPILQDIGLAMHPPVLYLGYVGFSISYSITISALILNKIDKFWAEIVRICSLISWCFLTAGIALGSWWAYRELGWGGFWFWDPVENASLMPWLSATALIHTINVYSKTGNLKQWSIILSIATFILSTLGMFLVRSGIVTSVHAFAADSSRGIYILSFLALLLLASTIIYMLKLNITREVTFPILSKPFFISINSLILVVAISTIIIGTIYPMILEILTGTKISVGAPYFNTVFNPMVIMLTGSCAIGSNLSWVKSKNFKKHILIFGLALISTSLFSIKINLAKEALATLGILFGLWLLFASISLLFTRDKKGSNFYNMFIGHLGFSIIVVSISMNAALNRETRTQLKIGETVNFLDYGISLSNIYYEKKANYLTQIAIIGIKSGNLKSSVKPEVRFFEVEQQQVVEPAIYKTVFSDLYITIDRIYSDQGVPVLIYYRPMIAWLWFGALLIVIAILRSAIISITNYFNK